MSEKRMVRSMDDRMFLGVAGGLARYFDLDVVLVRILFILAGILSAGHAIVIYLVLGILMPEDKVIATASGFDPEEIVVKEA